MPELHVAVVSSGRPGNVPAMEQLCDGLRPTWYVGDGEGGDYRYTGAGRVVEAGGLVPARNLALDDAGPEPCVQLSDDLRQVQWTESTERQRVQPSTVAEAVGRMLVAYGLVQAAGEYLDHLRPFRSRDTYLARTMLAPEPVKPRMIKLVRELAGAR